METKYHAILESPKIRGGGETVNSKTHRSWLAAGLGAFVFPLLIALSASPANAQCAQWDVSGEWQIVQSNKWIAGMALSQSGTEVTGTARDVLEAYIGNGPKIPVNGTMVGNKFNLTVYWKGGRVGAYRGTVDAGGGMKGTTYDKSQPSVRATWYSNRSMVCADADTPQPTAPSTTTTTPPRPPPIRHSGHDNTTPPRPPPIRHSGHDNSKPPVSPTISANPIAVSIPAGKAEGTTTLTWDAGPDHPDAQVRRKAGIGGQEILVDARPKGTLVVTVEPGKNYQFILKDSDQQLAKAVVLTKQ